MSTGIEVFFSYAREDEELCKKLEKHLSQLKRPGTINTWHDRNIHAGSEREREINAHLNTAQIILLLISPDFMASDYCCNVEMKRAIERHKRGEARVIPILLRPALWEDTPLHQLQVLPTNGRPITNWQQDKAFVHIAEEIKKVVQKLQEQPKSQEGKLQEKSTAALSPQNKRTDHQSVASPAQNKKPRSPATSPDKPAQSGQQSNNQTSNVFHAPVQGVISGGMNTIHFNNTLLPMEDAIAKGRGDAQRGYKALQRKDYSAAKQYLEAAARALSEDELPSEAAQIKYHIAIALLDGQRPFSITKPTMQHIDQMLRSAIKMQPLHSYYYTLALLKRDFARNGLPQYRYDAQNLHGKAQRINLTKTDKENLQILTLCQPRLVNDAKHWW
jgi:TIR domain